MSEIEEIIGKVKNEIPNIIIFQRTDSKENVEFGVWKFWLEENANRRISVEIQHGLVFACYSSDQFSNQDLLKYKDTAKWICNYFSESTKLIEKNYD